MSVDRGSAMAASIVRTCRSHGVDPAVVDVLSQAHALAMAPRVKRLADEDHPLFLHPGRTVLVLLRDAGVTDGVVLAAAALAESEDEELRVDVGTLTGGDGRADAEGGASALPPDVVELARAVPPAGSEGLAEALVVADEAVRLIALAERLDHLRHAHLRGSEQWPGWGGGADWRARVHGEAVAVYAPVAERTNEGLAGRYRYWCRMFERRFL